MKKSAVKSALALALCAAGCVSFAQQSSDTSGTSGATGPSNGSSAYPQDVNKTSPGMGLGKNQARLRGRWPC